MRGIVTDKAQIIVVTRLFVFWFQKLHERPGWFVAAFLFIFLSICISSMLQTSATFDETFHITEGVYPFTNAQLSVIFEHPPLVRTYAALPLIFFQKQLQLQWPQEKHSYQKFCDEFVWGANKKNSLLIIFLGRVMIVSLGVLLGFFIFKFAALLFGSQAGIFALFLYVFCPNCIAHSRLITTDIGGACFSFIALYFFWKFLFRRFSTNIFLFGLFLGFACSAKYSALFLYPFACGGVMFFTARGSRKKYFSGLLGAFLVSFFVIWANYGFQLKTLTTKAERPHFALDNLPIPEFGKTLAYGVVENLYFPWDFFKGIYGLSKHNLGGHPSYIRGIYSRSSVWYYYLYALFLKTPIPVLVLFLWVFWITVKRWRDQPKLFLLYALGVFFGVSFLSKQHVGIRHVILLYPILFVFISSLIRSLVCRVHSLKIAKIIVLIVLCGWYVFESMTHWPDYLSYFNNVIGKRENAYRHLVDSNLDWGQGLFQLKKFMDRENISRIKLVYFGTARPEAYGINYELLPSTFAQHLVRVGQACPGDFGSIPARGILAVSATDLTGVYIGGPGTYSWLRNYTPWEHLSGSIFIYRIPN